MHRTAMHSVFVLYATLSAAHAQPPPPAPQDEAQRLFEEGRTFAKEGKLVEACERFARSLALDHAVGTEVNLADCQDKLGKTRIAWQLFEHAAADAARLGDTKRAAFAHDRADTVAGKLATLVVKLPEPTRAGLAITIAGREVTPAPEIRDRVEPGPVEVVVTLPSHPRFAKTVAAAAGVSVTVDVPVDLVEHLPTVETQRDRGRVRTSYIVGAIGAASGLAAIALTLKGRHDYNSVADGDHCDRVTGGIVCDATGKEDIRSAQRLADIGTGFAIGAGVLLVTGVAIYATAPLEPRVAPVITPTSVGLVLTHRF